MILRWSFQGCLVSKIDRDRVLIRQRGELQQLFDTQINQIITLIDQQLGRLREKRPSAEIVE